MRETFFRGKTEDGEWYIGFYVCLHDYKGNMSYRIYSRYAETDCGDFYPDWFEVIPESVSEFTGLIDKNEAGIFEGDIVSIPFEEDRSPWEENCIYYEKAVVYFDTNRYGWYVRLCDGDCLSLREYDETDVEVIGNIYDNPELIDKECEIEWRV